MIPTRWLEQVDWDFKGPYPTSWTGKKWILSAIDEFSGWVENYPIVYKSDCVLALDKFIKQVGLMERIRTDNEPTFKGEDSEWQKHISKLRPAVTVLFSQPYEPAGNGRIERWNRTSGNAIRANLQGVDTRLWDYA